MSQPSSFVMINEDDCADVTKGDNDVTKGVDADAGSAAAAELPGRFGLYPDLRSENVAADTEEMQAPRNASPREPPKEPSPDQTPPEGTPPEQTQPEQTPPEQIPPEQTAGSASLQEAPAEQTRPEQTPQDQTPGSTCLQEPPKEATPEETPPEQTPESASLQEPAKEAPTEQSAKENDVTEGRGTATPGEPVGGEQHHDGLPTGGDTSPIAVQTEAPSASLPAPTKEALPPGHTGEETNPPSASDPTPPTLLQPSDLAHPLLSQPSGSAKLMSSLLSEAIQDTAETERPETKDEDREYIVLIIGKTGNGKSSLGNTITGARNFPVGRGMMATTREPQCVTAHVNGKRLKVIDTPDFTNLTTNTAQWPRHVDEWKQLTNARPDVIVLAVRCDIRYTKEEHAIYQEIKKLWGDESLFRQRLVVAFTIGDSQDEDLEEELKTVNNELKSVLEDAGNRFVQVNNKAKGEEKTEQLEDICHVLHPVITRKKEDDDRESFAILVIGNTGHGKSSVANMIVGHDVFPVGTGLSPVTTETSADTVCRAGRKFKVIDTPQLQLKDARSTIEQIKKWKTMTSPGPVVILMVVRCDVRFTSEEYAVYQDLKCRWGEVSPASENRLVVVFTFRDRVDYDLSGHVQKHPELSRILKDAGNAVLEVSNQASPEQKEDVVNTLISYIDAQGAASKWAMTSRHGHHTTFFGHTVHFSKVFEGANYDGTLKTGWCAVL